MMKTKIALSLLVALLVVVYVSGGLVTFDDPSDLGFAPTSLVLTYPGVLPFIHRVLGLVLVLGWIALTVSLRGELAYKRSALTAALILLELVLGLLISVNTARPVLSDYLVLAHFSVSGLIIIAGGLTLIKGLKS
ncbi:MAG: hypothetical protein QW514_08400 [Thermoprotei archaeon]